MNKYEEERESLRKQVELSQALDRLMNNPDFKKVILRGFCETEVINLNRQANLAVGSEAKLAKSQQAQAGPVLESYLTRIENEGSQARDNAAQLDILIREQESED